MDDLGSLGFSPALEARRTTSDHVVVALRTAILEGNFEDGEELNQVELARHFGVSRVPVREALRQLQAEGLVSAPAHHRAVVTGLGTDALIEAFELRAVVEKFLLEKAALKVDEQRLADLQALCNEMDKIVSRREWLAKNRAFHIKLYEPSGLKMSLELDERLMLRVERYMQGVGFIDPVEAGLDHREILDAVQHSDVERALAQVEEHINRSCWRLVERMSQGVTETE